MTIELVRPRALRPGDTLAVIAPASPVPDDQMADGAAQWRAFGFALRLMPSTEGGRGYLAAGSDAERAAELVEAFADPEIAGVICARGGYGAMRTLPHIDWAVIRAHPKVLVGYSDITALHGAIRRETGLVTFHGPMVGRQGGEPALHPWTEANVLTALTSTEPLGTLDTPEDLPAMTAVRGGAATGPLVGGNLTLVAALAGTPWQLDARDCVLLLEDTKESPYRIDRYLTQLRLAGILDGVRGVVFGHSPDCDRPADDPRTFPLLEVLADRLGPLGVPVLYGFPCGHTQWRATLPLGIPATLDADAGTLTLLEAACVA